MSNKVECPKCGSGGAWVQIEGPDTWIRCLCGFRKVVSTTLECMVIEHNDHEPVKVPKKDSNLWRCLITLAAVAPANTHEITRDVNAAFSSSMSTSDVASQLTVLRYKRLVFQEDDRRRMPGGSTWRCTDAALKLLGV